MRHSTKFNDPNEKYRNHGAECELSADLEPGDEAAAVTAVLRDMARDHCERERDRVKEIADLRKAFDSARSKANDRLYQLRRYEKDTVSYADNRRDFDAAVARVNELGRHLLEHGVQFVPLEVLAQNDQMQLREGTGVLDMSGALEGGADEED